LPDELRRKLPDELVDELLVGARTVDEIVRPARLAGAGDQEARIARTRQRRLKGFDEKILAVYSLGLLTHDIEPHLAEIYGVKVRRDLIGRVSHGGMEDVRARQPRPLETPRSAAGPPRNR
jgi:Transposase, Mutator family